MVRKREKPEGTEKRCTKHGKEGKLLQKFQNKARFIPVSTATYMYMHFSCSCIELKREAKVNVQFSIYFRNYHNLNPKTTDLISTFSCNVTRALENMPNCDGRLNECSLGYCV